MSSYQEVKNKLIPILIEELSLETTPIFPQSTIIKDLGVDPMDWLSIFHLIKKEFGIDFNSLLLLKSFTFTHSERMDLVPTYSILEINELDGLIHHPYAQSSIRKITIDYLIRFIIEALKPDSIFHKTRIP